MLCELCGKTTPAARTVAIEGSVLSVCPDCSRFGVPAAAPARRASGDPVVASRLEHRTRRLAERDVLTEIEGEEQVAGDLGERVRRARESRGWKQAELAARINEKASVVAKLESGGLVPNDALLRKIERALELKLREKVGKVAARKYAGPATTTLGDLVGLDEG